MTKKNTGKLLKDGLTNVRCVVSISCLLLNAPFCKISNSAKCGRFAMILYRFVKGSFFCVLCFLGQIVT